MEVVLAILAFMAVCAAFMAWDYYKPARLPIIYRSFPDKRPQGGESGNYHTSDGYSGDHFNGGDGGGD